MDILGFDPLAGGDFLLDQLRDSSACRACGAAEPVRLGPEGCSACYDGWPRCGICRRWVYDEATFWWEGYVWTLDETGADMRVCTACFRSAA